MFVIALQKDYKIGILNRIECIKDFTKPAAKVTLCLVSMQAISLLMNIKVIMHQEDIRHERQKSKRTQASSVW